MRIDAFPRMIGINESADAVLRVAKKKGEENILVERKRRKESHRSAPIANDEVLILLGTILVEVSKDLLRRVARLEAFSGKAPVAPVQDPKSDNSQPG